MRVISRINGPARAIQAGGKWHIISDSEDVVLTVSDEVFQACFRMARSSGPVMRRTPRPRLPEEVASLVPTPPPPPASRFSMPLPAKMARTSARFQILRVLNRQPEGQFTAKALARVLGRNPFSVSPVVSDLHKLGYVAADHPPVRGARMNPVKYRITSEGQALFKHFQA
jgi:hypothetical protein